MIQLNAVHHINSNSNSSSLNRSESKEHTPVFRPMLLRNNGSNSSSNNAKDRICTLRKTCTEAPKNFGATLSVSPLASPDRNLIILSQVRLLDCCHVKEVAYEQQFFDQNVKQQRLENPTETLFFRLIRARNR